MDYKEEYQKALERAKKGLPIDEVFPELKESEDERIRKFLVELVSNDKANNYNGLYKDRGVRFDDVLSYLEKQKEYISNNFDEVWEKEDCSEILAEGEKLTPEFKALFKKVCHAFFDKGVELTKKQKEQKPSESTALHKAFIRSKIDYALEEKCDASDYADAILPTSVACGENDEEYKLHKIIEAAFIAGQKKEQKPAEWSEEDERIVRFYEADYNNQIGDMPMKDVINMRLEFKNWLVNRLKSLRPQPHWKPSEEQIDALEWMLTTVSMKDGGRGVVLKNLIDDLKKQM